MGLKSKKADIVFDIVFMLWTLGGIGCCFFLDCLEFNLLSKIISSLYVIITAIVIFKLSVKEEETKPIYEHIGGFSNYSGVGGYKEYRFNYENWKEFGKIILLVIALIIFAILNFFLAKYLIFVWEIVSVFWAIAFFVTLYNLIKKIM